jgi:anti-sigma-K factor RskA
MSSDVHALVGAYAVDALDEAERIEFEKHLATCETCRAEVASLVEAATQLATLTETEPPAPLRAKVLADIATVRPLAPRTTPPERRRSLRPRLVALAAAAAVVVGAGAGVTAWHPWESGHSSVALSPEQVIAAADVQRTQTTLANGASLTLYRSPALDRAVLVTAGMPAAPSTKVYELWLQDGSGVMHPAGLMPATADATVVVGGGDAVDARGVGITVEPAGGSPAPTTTPVALLAFHDA